MKKTLILFSAFTAILWVVFLCYKLILTVTISNPQAENCKIQTEKIIAITKGSSKDIVFSDNKGDHYYINRGLDRGLNLDSLKAKVLNKTVTLHLPKVFGSKITSEHIAQLAIGNTIIFTEFN
jgi:hypothetical protein